MKSRGRAISQEQKEKLRLANLGKKLSPETKKKMREAHKGKGNYLWKGDDVSYGGLHYWVRRWLGRAKKCSICGGEGNGRPIQWANKDHYYRRNLSDWIPLCFKCHAEYDKKLGLRKHNLTKNKKNGYKK